MPRLTAAAEAAPLDVERRLDALIARLDSHHEQDGVTVFTCGLCLAVSPALAATSREGEV